MRSKHYRHLFIENLPVTKTNFFMQFYQIAAVGETQLPNLHPISETTAYFMSKNFYCISHRKIQNSNLVCNLLQPASPVRYMPLHFYKKKLPKPTCSNCNYMIIWQVSMGRRQQRNLAIFESSCHLLPHTVDVLHCLYLIAECQTGKL